MKATRLRSFIIQRGKNTIVERLKGPWSYIGSVSLVCIDYDYLYADSITFIHLDQLASYRRL